MIVVVPIDDPEMMPVMEPIVATDVLLLLHVPEPGASDKIALAPLQMCVIPRIAPGCRFTVAMVVVLQPVGNVYVILVVPATSPERIPEVPIVATLRLLLLHVPPEVALLSAVTAPAHTLPVPEIGAGATFTVSIAVLKQPAASWYVTIVVPEDRPEIMPVMEPIVATDVLALLHVPEPGASDNIALDPAQIGAVPSMAPGCRFTVATDTVLQPVGSI